jgi:hypothetical protein
MEFLTLQVKNEELYLGGSGLSQFRVGCICDEMLVVLETEGTRIALEDLAVFMKDVSGVRRHMLDVRAYGWSLPLTR